MSTLEFTNTVLGMSRVVRVDNDDSHIVGYEHVLPDVAADDARLASTEMQRREVDAQVAIVSERIALCKEKKQQAAALEESRKALRDLEANRVKLLADAKKEEEQAADARRQLVEAEQEACAQAKRNEDALREQTAKLQAAEQRDREEIAQAKREYEQNIAAMEEKTAQARQTQLMLEANRVARETSEARLAKVMEQITKSAAMFRDMTLAYEKQVAANNDGGDVGDDGNKRIGTNAGNNDDGDTDAQGDDDDGDNQEDTDDGDDSDAQDDEDDQESDNDEPSQSDVVTRRGKRHRQRITVMRRGAKKAKFDAQRGAKILKLWAPIGIDIYGEATAAEKASLKDVAFLQSESDETGAAALTVAIDREFRNLIRAGKVTETAALSKLAALVRAHVRVSKKHRWKSEPIEFGTAASDIVTAGLIVTSLDLPIAVITHNLMKHFPRRSIHEHAVNMFLSRGFKLASLPGIVDTGEKSNVSWERAWHNGLLVRAPAYQEISEFYTEHYFTKSNDLRRIWRIAADIEARGK